MAREVNYVSLGHVETTSGRYSYVVVSLTVARSKFIIASASSNDFWKNRQSITNVPSTHKQCLIEVNIG